MAHINKCIEVPPSSPITHLCSYSIKRICYGSLEKRQWTSMLLSGCRTVKLALACTAKRLVVYSLFISTRFYLFRSNSRWSIVAITAESVGLCAATHVVQRGADTRSKSSTYLWNSSATILLSRFLLPAQSSKPLRVCMTCYDELSSQSADQSYNKGKASS